MEKLQFDNDSFSLYSPDTLNYITNDLEYNLNEVMQFYKKLFDVDNFRKVQINYFDDRNKFKNYIYSLRGEKESLPDYAVGTFDKGMINAFIEKNMVIDSPRFIHKKYTANHELFHIMYRELILEKENKSRITWFDEGMAQLFSLEFRDTLENHFNYFYDKVIETTKSVPNLNLLVHGTNFNNKLYDGYNLSLISVKYIYDTLGFDEFKKLMHDNNRILSYGDNVVSKAIEYYGPIKVKKI